MISRLLVVDVSATLAAFARVQGAAQARVPKGEDGHDDDEGAVVRSPGGRAQGPEVGEYVDTSRRLVGNPSPGGEQANVTRQRDEHEIETVCRLRRQRLGTRPVLGICGSVLLDLLVWL